MCGVVVAGEATTNSGRGGPASPTRGCVDSEEAMEMERIRGQARRGVRGVCECRGRELQPWIKTVLAAEWRWQLVVLGGFPHVP
jgi:hypothetical protein